jgi:eukaryotic-like serine/threonine-protein kinase
MQANPFTYGNPISDPARFIGRQHAVEQVFSRLGNAEFESSSLVGERRVGKTSMLNYLAHPNVRHSFGLDPFNYLFIYVDLQMVDNDTTPVRLWKQLLQQMMRCCRHPEVKEVLERTRSHDSISTFDLDDVFNSLYERDQYVVFLLDEFENITTNENFGPDFYYGMRALAIRHNLSLITSSRRELVELCHSDAIRSSPFFNIFANINLRLFTEDEARRLISVSLAETGVSFTGEESDTIFRIAGRHPFFLQVACSGLFHAYSMNLSPEERLSELNRSFREEARPHIGDYWRNSDEDEKIVITALALLERQGRSETRTFSLRQLRNLYGRAEQTLARLERRGLLAASADMYCLSSEFFGEWICAEITDTMHDRQSYEEWLASSGGSLERLSANVKKDLGDILPRIGSAYRDLFIAWVSHPANLLAVGGLVRGAMGW